MYFHTCRLFIKTNMRALNVVGIKVDKKNIVNMFSMEREIFKFLSNPKIPLRHEREK